MTEIVIFRDVCTSQIVNSDIAPARQHDFGLIEYCYAIYIYLQYILTILIHKT